MTPHQKVVLFTGVEDALCWQLSRLLEDDGLRCIQQPWGHDVIDRVYAECVDVIVAGYPLPGADMGRLLSALRSKDSNSRRAGLILVAESGTVEKATTFIGRGINRVLMQSTPDDVLLDTIRELLQVAPRVTVRVPARVIASVGRGPKLSLCQTENVSASGMLLRGWDHYPVGFSFDFELNLPGEGDPIRGRARVSRVADEERERLAGVGVAFEALDPEDQRRLEQFLADNIN